MISHLDFCNGLLTSLSAFTLNCLQSILHPTVLLKYIRSCHSSCSTTSKGLPSYSEQPLHQHVRPCRTWILALLSFLTIPPTPITLFQPNWPAWGPSNSVLKPLQSLPLHLECPSHGYLHDSLSHFPQVSAPLSNTILLERSLTTLYKIATPQPKTL